MAGGAQFGLRFHQLRLLVFGLRRVTGDVIDSVFFVDRVDRVHVLQAIGVATHSPVVDFVGPKHS